MTEKPAPISYQKILRVPYGNLAQKETLSAKQMAELLDGDIVVEEKLDGKTEPRKVPNNPNIIVFGENLKYRHSIRYTRLPDWFIAFDILDTPEKRFLNHNEKKAMFAAYSFSSSPALYEGPGKSVEFLVDLIGRSTYSDETMEGVVVKNYGKQLFGKLVRADFVETIDREGHWIRRRKLEMNRLIPGTTARWG